MMIGKSITGGLSLYLIGGIVFLIIYYCYIKKKEFSMYRRIIFILFYIYMVIVIEKTCMPIPINDTQIEMWREGFSEFHNLDQYNLIPLLDFGNSLWRRNMILNIVMFMPFGFLWPLLRGKFCWKYLWISSLTFSSLIELYQFGMTLFIGVPLWYADINDLIANVLGGLIGYFLFTLVASFLFQRISNKDIYGKAYKKRVK